MLVIAGILWYNVKRNSYGGNLNVRLYRHKMHDLQ